MVDADCETAHNHSSPSGTIIKIILWNLNDMKVPIRLLSVTYLVLEGWENRCHRRIEPKRRGGSSTNSSGDLPCPSEWWERIFVTGAGWNGPERRAEFSALINKTLAPSSMILRKQSFGFIILSKAWVLCICMHVKLISIPADCLATSCRLHKSLSI